MIIENMTPELEDMRKAIVEMLFVEGNHLCPSCEKSGNCELQAMGYRYRMLVPRFPYLWPDRAVDASNTKVIHDAGRCIKCTRCMRGIANKRGHRFFNLLNRGINARIKIDKSVLNMTDAQAERAARICPVGAILLRDVGFAQPVGKRRFDANVLGGDESILNQQAPPTEII
jgi:[NiFe] hydrogenase diaphorase moiety small subunit